MAADQSVRQVLLLFEALFVRRKQMIEEVNPEERGVLMQAIKPVTDGEQPA